MIIKFREKDSWVMFGEIDHIEYRDVDTSKEAMSDDAIIFEPPSNQVPLTPNGRQQVAIGFFTKNMREATEILAYSPIYIMNDEGKTIETF